MCSNQCILWKEPFIKNQKYDTKIFQQEKKTLLNGIIIPFCVEIKITIKLWFRCVFGKLKIIQNCYSIVSLTQQNYDFIM